jgi:hypothetical protein
MIRIVRVDIFNPHSGGQSCPLNALRSRRFRSCSASRIIQAQRRQNGLSNRLRRRPGEFPPWER